MDTNLKDRLIQERFPTIMAPRYQALPPCPLHQTRLLMAWVDSTSTPCSPSEHSGGASGSPTGTCPMGRLQKWTNSQGFSRTPR